MRGDPRNQAVIIHEDGWAPHNTSAQHSVAAITITHACMTKVEWANSKHAKVYSFIPVSQLPRDSPHKYDAFLQPLIEELTNLYIDGCEVFFKSAVEELFPANDTPKLRVVPLLLTADLRAHAEIGQTSAGGFKGCRRCHVEGEYIPVHKHYYYGNFQNWFRFPATKRTAESNRLLGKKSGFCCNCSWVKTACQARRSDQREYPVSTLWFVQVWSCPWLGCWCDALPCLKSHPLWVGVAPTQRYRFRCSWWRWSVGKERTCRGFRKGWLV